MPVKAWGFRDKTIGVCHGLRVNTGETKNERRSRVRKIISKRIGETWPDQELAAEFQTFDLARRWRSEGVSNQEKVGEINRGRVTDSHLTQGKK